MEAADRPLSLTSAHEQMLATLRGHLELLGGLLTSRCDGKKLSLEKLLAIEEDIHALSGGRECQLVSDMPLPLQRAELGPSWSIGSHGTSGAATLEKLEEILPRAATLMPDGVHSTAPSAVFVDLDEVCVDYEDPANVTEYPAPLPVADDMSSSVSRPGPRASSVAARSKMADDTSPSDTRPGPRATSAAAIPSKAWISFPAPDRQVADEVPDSSRPGPRASPAAERSKGSSAPVGAPDEAITSNDKAGKRPLSLGCAGDDHPVSEDGLAVVHPEPVTESPPPMPEFAAPQYAMIKPVARASNTRPKSISFGAQMHSRPTSTVALASNAVVNTLSNGTNCAVFYSSHSSPPTEGGGGNGNSYDGDRRSTCMGGAPRRSNRSRVSDRDNNKTQATLTPAPTGLRKGLVKEVPEVTGLTAKNAVPRSEEYLRCQFKRLDGRKEGLLYASRFLDLAQREDIRCCEDGEPEIAPLTIDQVEEVFLALPIAFGLREKKSAVQTKSIDAIDNSSLETSIDVEIFVGMALSENVCDFVEEETWHSILRLRLILAKEARIYDKLREEAVIFAAQVKDQSKPIPSSNKMTQAKDMVVASVIMLNAVIIGLQADFEQHGPVWDGFEYFFTSFFVMEMVQKMYQYGLRWYFIGPEMAWNTFDFMVVVIALGEMTLTHTASAAEGNVTFFPDGFSGIIKMARLGRLFRLIRLLRFQIFNELKMMILGVFAGLRVLFWAIILFFFFIFMLALVLRELIGNDARLPLYTSKPFGKVPWAMFTIFRCFTDGCAARDGTPLQVHLYNLYGARFMIPYQIMFLFVTIGLFNLIMAIFVDNVTESNRIRKQEGRADDHETVRQRLRKLIVDLCHVTDHDGTIEKKNETRTMSVMERLCQPFTGKKKIELMDETDVKEPLVITRKVFTAWLSDPDFVDLLDELDVATSNRYDLFDVIDADLSGELEVEELIDGLSRLRGPAEKSDAVASLLCVRVVLETLREFEERAREDFRILIDTIGDMQDTMIKQQSIVPTRKQTDRSDESVAESNRDLWLTSASVMDHQEDMHDQPAQSSGRDVQSKPIGGCSGKNSDESADPSRSGGPGFTVTTLI